HYARRARRAVPLRRGIRAEGSGTLSGGGIAQSHRLGGGPHTAVLLSLRSQNWEVWRRCYRFAKDRRNSDPGLDGCRDVFPVAARPQKVSERIEGSYTPMITNFRLWPEAASSLSGPVDLF